MSGFSYPAFARQERTDACDLDFRVGFPVDQELLNGSDLRTGIGCAGDDAKSRIYNGLGR